MLSCFSKSMIYKGFDVDGLFLCVFLQRPPYQPNNVHTVPNGTKLFSSLKWCLQSQKHRTWHQDYGNTTRDFVCFLLVNAVLFLYSEYRVITTRLTLLYEGCRLTKHLYGRFNPGEITMTQALLKLGFLLPTGVFCLIVREVYQTIRKVSHYDVLITGWWSVQSSTETQLKLPQIKFLGFNTILITSSLKSGFLAFLSFVKSVHLERVTCFDPRPLAVLTFHCLSCHKQEGFQNIKHHCARGCFLLLKLAFVLLLAEHHAESSSHASLLAHQRCYTRPVCMWTCKGYGW